MSGIICKFPKVSDLMFAVDHIGMFGTPCFVNTASQIRHSRMS